REPRAFEHRNHMFGDHAKMLHISRLEMCRELSAGMKNPCVIAAGCCRYLDLGVALKLDNLLSRTESDLSVRSRANNAAVVNDLAPFNGLPLAIDHHQNHAPQPLGLPFTCMCRPCARSKKDADDRNAQNIHWSSPLVHD